MSFNKIENTLSENQSSQKNSSSFLIPRKEDYKKVAGKPDLHRHKGMSNIANPVTKRKPPNMHMRGEDKKNILNNIRQINQH